MHSWLRSVGLCSNNRKSYTRGCNPGHFLPSFPTMSPQELQPANPHMLRLQSFQSLPVGHLTLQLFQLPHSLFWHTFWEGETRIDNTENKQAHPCLTRPLKAFILKNKSHQTFLSLFSVPPWHCLTHCDCIQLPKPIKPIYIEQVQDLPSTCNWQFWAQHPTARV